jgi:hypothetical protein
MPIYTLDCYRCSKTSEHIMHHDEHRMEVKCPHCAASLTRHEHRAWGIDGRSMQIQGDTVAGGCDYNYYDDNLGVHLRGKQHRKDEMARQGLREYSPDPELKAGRDEAHYIRQHSRPGDPGVVDSVHKAITAPLKKQRERRIDAILDKAPPMMLPD